jgi:hypothetical protein
MGVPGYLPPLILVVSSIAVRFNRRRYLRSRGNPTTIEPIQRHAIALLSGKLATKGFSFSAGGGIATPFGGGNIGAGLEFNGWEQAVPLAVEIVRALSKGQSQEKIFGIDDAILIPVIATVAAEAIRRS